MSMFFMTQCQYPMANDKVLFPTPIFFSVWSFGIRACGNRNSGGRSGWESSKSWSPSRKRVNMSCANRRIEKSTHFQENCHTSSCWLWWSCYIWRVQYVWAVYSNKIYSFCVNPTLHVNHMVSQSIHTHTLGCICKCPMTSWWTNHRVWWCISEKKRRLDG